MVHPHLCVKKKIKTPNISAFSKNFKCILNFEKFEHLKNLNYNAFFLLQME